MDYGERQERAEMLVKHFREQGDEVLLNGRTGDQIAQDIEDQNDEGRTTVAIAGLVLFAKSQDPSLGKHS